MLYLNEVAVVLNSLHLDTIMIVIVIIQLHLLQFHLWHTPFGLSECVVLSIRVILFAHRLGLLPFLVVAKEVLLSVRLSGAVILVFRRGLRSSMKFGFLECLPRHHLDLEAVLPSLLGELHADFMGIFGGLLLQAFYRFLDFIIDVSV